MMTQPNKSRRPQPTLQTVLERINALDQKLTSEIHALDEKLSGEIQGLKAEVKHMNRKFEIMTGEWLDLKTRSREAEAGLDELERKAS
jgi:chromosome segregation ATPase